MSERRGIRHAGDYELEVLDLYTVSGRVFDLREVYVSLDIYEDIMSHAITGTLTFKDTNNLISIAPIIGQEQLALKVKTPQKNDYEEAIIDFTKNYLHVFKILTTAKINDYTKSVTISFTTFDVFMNSRVRVSKVYDGEPAEDMVQKILSDKKLINSTKKLNYEKSINNFKMVFPNVKPFRAIDMIAKRCVSKYNLSPTFIFYENCFGYNFKSLESIYHKDPVLGRYKQNISNLDSYTSSLHEEVLNIRDFKLLRSKDNLINLMNGLYSSNLVTYDWFSKKITSNSIGEQNVAENYEFNYIEDHIKSNTMTVNTGQKLHPGYPLLSESTGYDGKRISDFPDSVIFLESEVSNSNDKNKLFSELNNKSYDYPYDPNNPKSWLMKRRSKLGFLSQGVQLEVEVNGTTNLRVGGLIELEIPNTTNIKGEDKKDKRLSGRFLITKLHHTFSFEEGSTDLEKHICRMRVIRDDYGGKILPSQNSQIDGGRFSSHDVWSSTSIEKGRPMG